MAFFKLFSGAVASDDDLRRFRRAALGLVGAGVLAAVCAAVGTALVPEKEVLRASHESASRMVGALPNFWRFKFLVVGEGLLFLLSCLYPLRFRRRFRYIEGAAATILAFAVISHFGFVLVLWTGNLNTSVFAATFLSFFGFAVLIPEDTAIRTVLATLVFVESIALVVMDPVNLQHNSVVLLLSLIAYGSAGLVRWFLVRGTI